MLRKTLIAPAAVSVVVATSLLATPSASTAQVAQAVWGPPTPITESPQYTDTADVAVDAAGGTTAVWTQDGVVQAAFRPAGGTWQTPDPLGRGCGPQVGADDRGDVVVIWECGPEGTVMSASRPVGGSWSAPVAVTEPSADDGFLAAYYPRLAVSRGGAAVVSWWFGIADEVPDPPAARAEAAYRSAAGRWSAPHILGWARDDDPAVAIDARGNVTFVFLDTGRRVRAARRVAGRGWLSPVRISADRPQTGDVDVAVNSRGDATAAWYLNGHGLQAATRPQNRRWSAPTSLNMSGDWALATDDAGTALVVEAHANGRIGLRAKPLHRSWRPQRTVVAADGSTRANLQLLLNPDRDALLSWNQSIEHSESLAFSSYRPRGGPWGAQQRYARHTWEPATALYRNGNAVATWIQETFSGTLGTYHVFAQTMKAPR